MCKRQPQEVRVGMGVKARGAAYVDSERNRLEMWFKRDDMNLIMVGVGGSL